MGGLAADKVSALCDEATPFAERAELVRLARILQRPRAAGRQGRGGGPHYPDSLSGREVNVLRLISDGLNNAQIGEKLFISRHTVANHVQSILSKTGAANRTEAAARGIRRGLTAETRKDSKLTTAPGSAQ